MRKIIKIKVLISGLIFFFTLIGVNGYIQLPGIDISATSIGVSLLNAMLIYVLITCFQTTAHAALKQSLAFIICVCIAAHWAVFSRFVLAINMPYEGLFYLSILVPKAAAIYVSALASDWQK